MNQNFKIVHYKDDDTDAYKYLNVNDPNEKYIQIYTEGRINMDSVVTFKPANIPGAPVIEASSYADISLPQSVDEWEIKYYSNVWPMSSPLPEDLKNAGVVNLKEFFGEYISEGLLLKVSTGQYIAPLDYREFRYYIPEV